MSAAHLPRPSSSASTTPLDRSPAKQPPRDRDGQVIGLSRTRVWEVPLAFEDGREAAVRFSLVVGAHRSADDAVLMGDIQPEDVEAVTEVLLLVEQNLLRQLEEGQQSAGSVDSSALPGCAEAVKLYEEEDVFVLPTAFSPSSGRKVKRARLALMDTKSGQACASSRPPPLPFGRPNRLEGEQITLDNGAGTVGDLNGGGMDVDISPF